MTTDLLMQHLRDFTPEEFNWKFILYNTKKSVDGTEMDVYSCKTEDPIRYINDLKTVLLTKTLAERSVTEYTPFLSKDTIGVMDRSSDLIKEQITSITANVRSSESHRPESFVTGILPAPKGFMFYGYQKETTDTKPGRKPLNDILLIKRGNPFLSGNKLLLCTEENGVVTETKKPILKFPKTLDFLMIKDTGCIISENIEKDFGMNERHFAICAKHMKMISEAGMTNDFESFEYYSYKSAKKFINFDMKIYEHINSLSIEYKTEFLSKFGIIVNEKGQLDTYDKEQCELLIDLLCCRSCIDPLGRLSVGKNIMPR